MPKGQSGETAGVKIINHLRMFPQSSQRDIHLGTGVSMAIISGVCAALVEVEMAYTTTEKRGPGYATTLYELAVWNRVKVESPWDVK